MTEEITLETINTKLDTIIDKEDTIIGILNAHTTAINSILNTVNGLTTPTETEDPVDETTSQFKTELQNKINEGLPYDQVKQWIIQTLTDENIYSEEDIVIKIFPHIDGDIILEVKSRPYVHWGKLLQFLQDTMGDTDKFETSRYTMKIVEWWKLTHNQQMETQTSSTDIVDEVNEDWGDNDNVNQHIGNG